MRFSKKLEVIHFQLAIVIAMIIAWFVNLVQFFMCDFESPFKEEIIHAFGIFMPPISVITVWF